MLKRIIAPGMLVLASAFWPTAAAAQPVLLKTSDSCEKWGWLLGTWDSFSPWADQTKPTGGTLIFTIGAGGTVEGKIGRLNSAMEESGYTSGMVVFRGFGQVYSYGPDGTTTFESRDGEFLQIDGEASAWRPDAIGVRPNRNLYMTPPAISRLGGGGPFRKSGSQTSSACGSGNAAETSEAAASGGPGAEAREAETASTARDPDRKRRCDQFSYTTLLNTSASRVIVNFDKATDETAGRGTADLPGARLYPLPFDPRKDRPDFLSAEDARLISQIELLSGQATNNRGPDDWLGSARKQLHDLHVVARDLYDGAGKRASDNFEPCPPYEEARPYAKLTEAERLMADLRKRKSDYVMPLLAKADALNERLTREFYGELADASSLKDKAKGWALGEIRSFMDGEQIDKAKTEALLPQLDALQDTYRELEAAGTPVSDTQRQQDIAEAMRRAGIDYTPKSAADIADEHYDASYRKVASYILAKIVAEGAPAVLQRGSKYLGRAGAVLDVLEILNATKNAYSLWGVRQELMPTALALQESRAYLTALVDRYDRMEAEYATLKPAFKKAVSDSAALGEKDH